MIEAKRQAKVWTKVATSIATETAEAIPAPQPAPRTPSSEDVRINRISPQGKSQRVYEGIYTEDLPERSQGHADRSGCLVEMHNATGRKVFHPETPRQSEDSPPISDTPKVIVEVYQLHDDGKLTLVMELDDGSGWVSRCEDYVKDTNITLKAKVGDKYTRFFECYQAWLAARKPPYYQNRSVSLRRRA